ncbi:GGDEF domain-containing protein, partial [Enterobacter cloacae]|nr:GGDEF domain-containing protein [Enterobacter cloacae]
MTSQSWRSLVNSKYQLSLRLFLFLNATSAVFSVTNPLYSVQLLSFPLLAIFTLSTGLLLWHWQKCTRKINIPVVSAIFGILWAWQIASKFSLITHDRATYLIMALLTVLFIGSLAFAINIKAFTLHSLPAFIVCLWLSPSEHWLRMIYSFILPVVAIGVHHVLQRRNDRFAQELLSRLLEE